MPARPLARPAAPAPGHDYADACEVTTTVERAAADWLRAMLEGAPVWSRLSLRSGWTLLGVDRPGGPGTVLGWPLVVESTDRALLRSRSARIGFATDLVVTRDRDVVRFETLQALDTAPARALWAAIGGFHRLTVRALLARAARR